MPLLPRLIALTLLTLLPLIGCGESDIGDGEPTGDSVGQLAPGGTGDGGVDTTASDTTGPVVTHEATIVTDRGEMVVGLYGVDAPLAVANFVGLAEKGFYDSLLFHKVVPGFVIQTGDPLTRDTARRAEWGSGGEALNGKPFADELDPNAPSGKLGYVEGVVAMAGNGPDANTSQFFIVLTTAGASSLTHDYTIFGRVLSGMETARKIEETSRVVRTNESTGRNDTLTIQTPPAPAMIVSVEIEEVAVQE